MKKLAIPTIFLLVLVVLVYTYNCYLTTNNIVGTYVNKGYKVKASVVEIPNIADTLILQTNGRFKSPYWGEGSYRISHTLFSTSITLSYNYKFGKGEIESVVKRHKLKSIRIELDEDNGSYYEKIN